MKFELDRNNRDQPDDVLLDDLREASSKLGAGKLTRDAYSKVGRFSAATIAARFGGWGKALGRAGVNSSRHFAVSRLECLDDLRRVASDIGVDTLTVAHYRKRGRYSEKPFKRHFGNWVGAVEAAGLGVSDQYHRKASAEELFDNLEVVWQRLGRQPTVNDMFPPLSRYSAHSYKRRFGGFRKALEAFVEASKATQPTSDQEAVARTRPSIQGPSDERVGSRSVGWRLRYSVLKRDRFTCQACGRSPANDPGTVLEVDHVIPWSRGGSTNQSNLQTLCERCNGGKGAG